MLLNKKGIEAPSMQMKDYLPSKRTANQCKDTLSKKAVLERGMNMNNIDFFSNIIINKFCQCLHKSNNLLYSASFLVNARIYFNKGIFGPHLRSRNGVYYS